MATYEMNFETSSNSRSQRGKQQTHQLKSLLQIRSEKYILYTLELILKTTKEMKKQLQNLILIHGIAFAFLLLTVWYRYQYYQQKGRGHESFFMNHSVIKTKDVDCDGWCLGHVIHYAFVGYFAPALIVPALIIGVFFEVLEMQFHEASNGIINGNINRDMVYNLIGLVIGYTLFCAKSR